MQAGPEDSPNANASPNTKDPVTGAILPLFSFPGCDGRRLLAESWLASISTRQFVAQLAAPGHRGQQTGLWEPYFHTEVAEPLSELCVKSFLSQRTRRKTS
jgi:hypothetical protein